jgi:hypothetical protein
MNHNFTKLQLLRNKEFYFVNTKEERVYFTVPTLDDYIGDEKMLNFFSLLQVSLNDLNEETKIENKLELLMYLLNSELYLAEIVETLHKLMKDVSVRTTGLFYKDYSIQPQEFEWLLNSWLISLGIKSFDEKPEEPDVVLSDMDRKMKESEEKIKRIKQKREEETNSELSLDKILAAVMKEFRLKMSELLEMNLFSIFWYYNMSLRYNNYRVETIAYGNGLIKKHKYFIE